MKFDWVFFDLGSTLTDESEFMEHLFRKAYESLEAEGGETTWKVFQNNLQGRARIPGSSTILFQQFQQLTQSFYVYVCIHI